MTIKVKSANQVLPVAASPAQIAEIQADLNIATPTIVQTIVEANSNLGALALPVQTLINAGIVLAQDRTNHTNFDPASNVNVILPGSGTVQTLQAYINALELRLTTLGSTAPANTVQPTAPTGTLTVGSTLTAVTGTWTGASTYNYVWYRVNVTSGAFTATGSTAATYVLQAADAGFKMAVSIAGVSSAGVTAAPVISALTASAIGVTLPTISVAPAVTPSGTQAVGVLLTCSTGTWNNASGAVYTYQWTLNGAAISGATSSTYTLISGQESGSVLCRVLATTTQGAAASPANSNTITVAALPVLTAVSPPAFPATVTVQIGAPITLSTWSITPDSTRQFRFYVAEGTGGTTTPYATVTGASATYTPEADGSSFLLSATGLTTLVGKTVYVDEVVTYLGVSYTSAKSTGKVVAAPSATLATSLDSTGLSWTQNSAITSIKPVSATGGQLPYTYSISGTALPSGLSLNTSTGFISGTPTITSSVTSYTILVTDGLSATSSKIFTATVSSSLITPLTSAFRAPSTLGYSGIYELEAPNDTDTTGYASHTFTNGNSLPPLSAMGSVSRGGNITLGPTTLGGLSVVRHEIRQAYPLRNSGARSELTFDNLEMVNDVDYWFAHAFHPDSNMTLANFGGAGDRFSIWQIHQDSSISPGQNPFGCYIFGDASVGQELQWYTALNSTAASRTVYRSSINAGQWWRAITHVRMSQTNAILEVWVAYGSGSYTKLTEISAGASTAAWGEAAASASRPYYTKTGFYKFTTGVWGTATTRGMYSSGAFFGQGTNLFNEAAAALTSFAIAT